VRIDEFFTTRAKMKEAHQTAREMIRLLGAHGYITNNVETSEREHLAIAVVFTSAFFGARSFTWLVRILTLVWSVWEESMDSIADAGEVDKETLQEMLSKWIPPSDMKKM
jgi:hypothetical protein